VLIFSSLIFDTDHKAKLLGYMSTAMLYADKNVDPHVVSCNRFENTWPIHSPGTELRSCMARQAPERPLYAKPWLTS
jgi:hypothetical protein